MRMGTPIVDIGTGLYSVIAILMALHERSKSGLGQYCDMTLHDCAWHCCTRRQPISSSTQTPDADGQSAPQPGAYEKYQTRTCEIFIASGNNGQWRKLTEALGKPELGTDPCFLNNADRLVNRAAMIAELEKLLSDRDGHEFCLSLLRQAAGRPGAAIDESMAAEHTAAREMVTELDAIAAWAHPSSCPAPRWHRRKPPRYGEHGTKCWASTVLGSRDRDAEVGGFCIRLEGNKRLRRARP